MLRSEYSMRVKTYTDSTISSFYHTVQLLLRVLHKPSATFRVVLHKHVPNITVPLQLSGAYFKCHQSASGFSDSDRTCPGAQSDTEVEPVWRCHYTGTHHLKKNKNSDGLKVAKKTYWRHHFTFGAVRNLPVSMLIGSDLSFKTLNGHLTAVKKHSHQGREEKTGMEVEDETKARLLWLMCDKCSQLGVFSRSLKQVIMQEWLPALLRPTQYWFSEMHATDDVCFFLKRLATPPNTLTHTLLQVSWGQIGFEQLLLNCNISSKTAFWSCGCRREGNTTKL